MQLGKSNITINIAINIETLIYAIFLCTIYYIIFK